MGKLTAQPANEEAKGHAEDSHLPEITILAPSRMPKKPLEEEYAIQLEWDGLWQIPISEVAALVLKEGK